MPRHSIPLAVLLTLALATGALGARPGLAASGAAPALLYAGLQDGHIYQSSNGGLGWREADTGMPGGVDVTALAAPSASGNVVYAGTGGAGVFATTDGGRTWQDGNGGNPDLANDRVHWLAAAGGVLYAVGDSAIYRTVRGGRYWSTIAIPASGPISAFAVASGHPGRLYLSAGYDGTLSSADGGAHWIGAPHDIPSGVVVNALAVSPSDADVAYAATSDGIYQTIDGGATWLPERRGIDGGAELQTVAVDPNNPALALAAGTDGGNARFYRSTDGGSSWHDIQPAGNAQIGLLLFDPAYRGAVLAGILGGWLFYSSADSGAHWTALPSSFGYGTSVLCLAGRIRRVLPTDPVAAPPGGVPGLRYFPASHHLVAGPLLAFYDRYGGLKAFGLPLTETFVEGGQVVQYFQRALLMLRGTPASVSPLGTTLTTGRHFRTVAPFAGSTSRRYFPVTRHSLSGPFLAYWLHHNGSLLLGAPISEPLREGNGDGTGRTYLMQYFQNARLEYHPEPAGIHDTVSLGLLGTQVLRGRGWL